jgi:hypothetical protein
MTKFYLNPTSPPQDETLASNQFIFAEPNNVRHATEHIGRDTYRSFL